MPIKVTLKMKKGPKYIKKKQHTIITQHNTKDKAVGFYLLEKKGLTKKSKKTK